MKKLFLFFFILLSNSFLYSQSFTFVRTSPAIVQGNADTILDSFAHITNLTSGNITVRFTISNMIVPSGWDTIAMCTWRNCYGPGTYVIDEILGPGEQEIHLYVYPYLIPGSGSCRVTASHLSTSVPLDFGFQANPIGIQQISSIVKDYSLSQNFPNPFNPSTKINFSIPKKDNVTLKVYDILGRELSIIVNEILTPGEYQVDFNAANLSSGTYIYAINSGGYTEIKKLTIIK